MLNLYCLKYAQSVLAENLAFIDGDKEKVIPISFAVYLIKTQNKNILVDVGCDTMPGFVMEKFYSPAFVLRQIGMTAEDITDIIITHAHHDHIEAVKHFKNAKVHITKAEYEFSKDKFLKNFDVCVFEKEFVIDDNIKIIEIAGHSLGSAIVEMRTEAAVIVLAGDECYTNKNIQNKICTGTFHNKEKCLEFVEKYSDKKYKVYTCHDISLKTERII